MPLFAAAYVSTPTIRFSDREVVDLLLSCRRFNAQHAVTGKLIVAEVETDPGTTEVVRFVQWLEGAVEDVRAALERIRSDARHHRIELQYFGPLEARRFPDWDMAFEQVPVALVAEAQDDLVPAPESLDIDDVLDSANGA